MVLVFGMSKVLPRFKTRDIKNVPEITGAYCYVMEDCSDEGFSLMIKRKSIKEVEFKFGDFSGNEINIMGNHRYKEHISKLFENECINKYIKMLGLLGVDQIQLCFGFNNIGDLRLVESMTHLNKYQSPGMIRDMLASCGVPNPSVRSIDIIDDEMMSTLADEGGYILYPSYPKFMTRDGKSELIKARIKSK